MKIKFILLAAMFTFISCEKTQFREGKFFAGGKYVEADMLNLGQTTYMEYCFACHGVTGDGKGVAAKGLYPPVRNFKSGLFKFGLVLDGELPHDDQLINIVKKGLNGTPMLPWDISDKRAEAVIHYIKTFAPEVWEGKDKKLGTKIKLEKDPFGLARKDSAISLGKEIYHFTANCNSCHRGYIDVNEYNQLAPKYEEDKVNKLDSDFFALKPQESEYGAKMIPPDFTWHEVRSAKTVEELAYRIAAGVTGVMPTWKGVITDQEIWAVSYYVKSLMELKDHPNRKTLMSGLKN